MVPFKIGLFYHISPKYTSGIAEFPRLCYTVSGDHNEQHSTFFCRRRYCCPDFAGDPIFQKAYILLMTVIPENLKQMIRECVSFCRVCGAEECFITRKGKKISVMGRYFLDYRKQKVIDYAERHRDRVAEHKFNIQFSHSVVSDCLQPHGLQYTRPPCPSPTPGVHSDSRPLSQ